MHATIARFGPAVCALLALGASVYGAEDPDKVKQSIERAVAYLKQNATKSEGVGFGALGAPEAPPPGGGQAQSTGGFQEGPAVLAGIALLEAGVPASDPVIQSIAKIAREAGIAQTGTYQLALDILLLDKLGEKIDTVLIQSMGVRLMAGQYTGAGWNAGGWTYGVPGPDEQELNRLRRALSGAILKGTTQIVGSDINGRPPLDKDVEEMMKQKRFDRNGRVNGQTTDNSNTQFAFLALWAARRHGVPVDDALRRAELRFRSTFNRGGWSYQQFNPPTPSMTCVGLLGLAVASGMRGEKRMKGVSIDSDGRLNLPRSEKLKPTGKPLEDPLVRAGLQYLGNVLAANRGAAPKKNNNPNPGVAGPAPGAPRLPVGNSGGTAGGIAAPPGLPTGAGGGAPPGGQMSDIRQDLYFMWCIERVSMVFQLEKIGNINWHEWGSSYLLASQNEDGSWIGRSNHKAGNVADTSFGLMFMCRSNIIRDLNKVLKATAELDKLKPSEERPGDKSADIAGSKSGTETAPTTLGATAESLAKALVQATGGERTKLIKEYTEEKGGKFSQALVQAIPQLRGEDLKAARYGLAERMGRMTADTLRRYMQDENPELRSAACWGACRADDSKSLVPDLIKALEDPEEMVWTKARLSLKDISGRNFGPKDGDSAAKRKEAAGLWLAWWKMQTK